MKHFVSDPIQAFRTEFDEALAFQVPQPETVALATVDQDGLPVVRYVLYKGIIRNGLSFFTNYNSPKASQLDSKKNASIAFYWHPLNRQIRVSGVIERATREESIAYFKTRPRISQLGAWASNQSQKISSIDDLNAEVEKIESQWAGREVECPPHWGGYVLQPLRMEFWYGKEGRLHERYVYQRASLKDLWSTTMLSP